MDEVGRGKDMIIRREKNKKVSKRLQPRYLQNPKDMRTGIAQFIEAFLNDQNDVFHNVITSFSYENT